jgi:hypothetical protein
VVGEQEGELDADFWSVFLPRAATNNSAHYRCGEPSMKATTVCKPPPSHAMRMQHGAPIRRRILTSCAFDTRPGSELLQVVVS